MLRLKKNLCVLGIQKYTYIHVHTYICIDLFRGKTALYLEFALTCSSSTKRGSTRNRRNKMGKDYNDNV